MKFRFRLVENILNEDIAAVKKQYPNMSDDLFMKLIAFDPTYNPNRDSVGTYGKWILNNYNKGNITDNDFGHLKDALSRFEDNKSKLIQKDIGKYKTLDELDAMLDDESSYKELSHRQEVKQRQKARRNADLDEEASLVYEDDEWEVWIPHTYAASCKLGQGASWCTASTERDYYYNYYKDNYGGEYYIIINKKDPKEKYQFHFESEQFMDVDDYPVSLEDVFEKDKGLEEFFMPIIKKHLKMNDEDTQEVTLSSRELLDLFDSYYPNSRDAISGDFCQKIIREMYNIGSAVLEELRDWDWSSWASVSYLVDAIERLDDSDFENISFTKEQFIALVEDDEDEYDNLGGNEVAPFDEVQSDARQASWQAWDDAHCYDTAEEIINSFKHALESAGFEIVEDGVIYTQNNKEVLENYLKYGREEGEDISLLDNFKFYEPYYGWNEMSDETFADCLEDRLSEYF